MYNKLDEKYYLNFSKSHHLYEMVITDFKMIWSMPLTEEHFLKCLKESNKRLQISEEILISQVENMLYKPEGTTVNLTLYDRSMEIDIGIKSESGYPIKFNIMVWKGSEEMFFEKVTKPLFGVVKDLHESQRELIAMLYKKDREIEDYRLQGTKLSLKYLKTPVFIEKEYLMHHTELDEVFGDKIPDTVLEDNFEDSSTFLINEGTFSSIITSGVKLEPGELSAPSSPTDKDIKFEPTPKKLKRHFLNM